MIKTFTMHVCQIEVSKTDLLKKILEIHELMPLQWDPEHRSSSEYQQELLNRIQSANGAEGFWVLSENIECTPDSIAGILWAKIIKTNHDGVISCGINSIWIHPNFRDRQLMSHFSETFLKWAEQHGAERIDCSTHINNHRMRSILEAKGFKPSMISYSIRI